MTPMQIMEQLDQCILVLEKGNIQLKTLSIEKSKTEREYKIALAKKQLMLKVEKYPVTLITDLAKGDEKVANLKFKRDVSSDDYFNCISSLDNVKIQIEILRSKLRWFREEYHHS